MINNSVRTALPNTHPNLAHLRDGEVVLYKRPNSKVWQARFKLYDRHWHSVSTRHCNLDYAIRVAGEIYDEARFRERLGLTHTRRKFEQVARACITELDTEHEAGIKVITNSNADIHTLANQMGTSVGMIERHFSKLTATMAADRLA